MPMMTMLLIFICVYFTLLVVILTHKKYINIKIANFTFIIVNTILFIGYYLNDFVRKGMVESLTFDQISPFTFTMLSASFLLNDKVKQYFFSSVAFLSIGMLVAMIVSPQQAFLGSFRLDASMLYVLDTLEHLNCSLFGIFLVASGQVKLNADSLKKAFIWIYSVIALVLVMNFTFHLNYFNMGPYGKYSIYMFNLFDSYWLTLFVYLLGVSLVLMLGYGFNYVILKLTEEIETLNNEEV